MTDIALDEKIVAAPIKAALDRFEKAAFAKFANLPRGKAERAEAVASREAEYNSSRQAIRAYLRVSPSQVAPANPAQVTDAMVDDAKLAWNGPDYIGLTDDLREALTAAIGAGGQAVAWTNELELRRAIGAETVGRMSGYRDDKFDVPLYENPTLSQPHPADERVVEALHNAKVLLTALTGPDDAIAQATIAGIDAALATEGRNNG